MISAFILRIAKNLTPSPQARESFDERRHEAETANATPTFSSHGRSSGSHEHVERLIERPRRKVTKSGGLWRNAFLALALPLLAGAAQAQLSRNGVPDWEVDPKFKRDVFTFARVEYGSYGFRDGYFGRRRGGGWATDYPDAELNLAFRLQQMTSLKVDPEPVTVILDRDDLSNYPFLYIVEPGRLTFRETEVVALRKHLLNGGFLMIDDFWGEAEWHNIREQLMLVFPNREIVDLPIEHPIFHTVFDLKEKPQVPNIGLGMESQYTGITWERSDAKEAHYRGIFDDRGRMMVIICHNTDLGDGWEQEGVSKYYFHEFAEKKAYPMAINIIFYAMTH